MTKHYGTPCSRSIGPDVATSESLAECSLGAQLLYDRLIAASDDQGRQFGDLLAVKVACFPLVRSVTPAKVDTWLDELAAKNIVCRYSVRGRDLLQLVSWWKFQDWMRRAYPSKWDPPPGWEDRVYGRRGDPDRAEDAPHSAENVPHISGTKPALAQAPAEAPAQAEAQGSELRSGEPSPAAPPPAPTPEAPKSARRSRPPSPGQLEIVLPDGRSPFVVFRDGWEALFLEHKGSRYAFDGGKDGKLVSEILTLAGLRREPRSTPEGAAAAVALALERATGLLTSTDPFLVGKGVDLGVLRSQWNRLASAGKGVSTAPGRRDPLAGVKSLAAKLEGVARV